MSNDGTITIRTILREASRYGIDKAIERDGDDLDEQLDERLDAPIVVAVAKDVHDQIDAAIALSKPGPMTCRVIKPIAVSLKALTDAGRDPVLLIWLAEPHIVTKEKS